MGQAPAKPEAAARPRRKLTDRLFDAFLYLAALGFLATAGLAVAIFASGRVSPDQVSKISAVMGGSAEPVDPKELGELRKKAAAHDELLKAKGVTSQTLYDAKEEIDRRAQMLRLEAEKNRRMLDALMDEIKSREEAFAKERERMGGEILLLRQKTSEKEEAARKAGLQQMIKIWNAMEPETVAAQIELIYAQDKSRAAELVAEMKTTRAAEILEAVKDPATRREIGALIMKEKPPSGVSASTQP